MIRQQSTKGLMTLVVTLVLGIGLFVGCSNKQNSRNGMESDSMDNGQMNMSDGMNSDSMGMQNAAYEATLKGSNEVPSNDSNGSGTVMVTMEGDSSIHVSGQFSGLSSAYTASHIHMGAKGENGSVIQPLDPDMKSDNMSGSFDSSYTLNASQMQALKNGNLYVNVHSQDHPKGELRGQLMSSKGMNSSGSNM